MGDVITEIRQMWPDLVVVHGKPRHSESQGGIERYNRTVVEKLGNWMKQNKSCAWASVGRQQQPVHHVPHSPPRPPLKPDSPPPPTLQAHCQVADQLPAECSDGEDAIRARLRSASEVRTVWAAHRPGHPEGAAH